jgi:hypothetical protein
LAKNQKLGLLDKLKGGSEKLGLSDPKVFITIGLIVFNLISWAMIPWWWNIITYTWWVFAIFNVGFWLVFYLRTIKVKNKNGEDTDKNNSDALKVAILITIGLVVGLITTAGYYFQHDGLSIKEYTRKMTVEEPLRRHSILRAICMAESHCQQFESDGKTVLRGRIDPDDTGMFQINKRIHAKLIAETRLDPETTEGNIKLANVLYDKYGTTPWNASRSRWAKELERISPTIREPFILAVIEVPTDKWSDENDVNNPFIPKTNIVWGRTDRTKGGNCEVMLDKDSQKVFPITETHNEFSPGIIQFKCTEPAQMRVNVVPSI